MNWLLIPAAALVYIAGYRLGRRSAFDQMNGRRNSFWYTRAL